MPHITAQMRSLYMKQDDPVSTKTPKLSGEISRQRINDSSSTSGHLRYLSTNSLFASTNASSPSLVLSHSPRKRKFNILLTPSSIASSTFDSPIKSSPLPSVSNPQSFVAVKRGVTPVAELEDTSPAYHFSELEDTSEAAIVSLNQRAMSPYRLTSRNTASQTLVAAIDRRFSGYEEENRQLRRSLAAKEKSLMEAQTSITESKNALAAAKEIIADRDYEMQHISRLNEELEKDVAHCHQHHHPPPIPSKSRDLDAPLSVFNPVSTRSSVTVTPTKSAVNLSPSAAGSPFVNSRKSFERVSSPSSTTSSPKSVVASASSGVLSPSVGGSPYAKPHNSTYNTSPSAAYVPLTAKALSAAISSAAASKPLPGDADNHQVTPLGYVVSLTDDDNTKQIISSDTELHHLKNRRLVPIRSSVSSPNLPPLAPRHPLSPHDCIPQNPGLTAMMSGGLAVPEPITQEMVDLRLRKKRGGLGDLFRRKEDGIDGTFN